MPRETFWLRIDANNRQPSRACWARQAWWRPPRPPLWRLQTADAAVAVAPNVAPTAAVARGCCGAPVVAEGGSGCGGDGGSGGGATTRGGGGGIASVGVRGGTGQRQRVETVDGVARS
jgi:hypothetical protein